MRSALRSRLEAAGIAPECVATIELVRDLLARVGDQWTVLVITALADGPLRFTTLHERIAGVSQRMLGQTLRQLTRDGLVTRTAYPEMPPRVEYELTDLGRSLGETVAHMVRWVQDHQTDIARNREDFDSTQTAAS
ncbi:MAG: helix-turn-helix transcriptional regulator [Streptomycetaceae bacterium]|jgi:DNA-binding HxlR family transcriptional regulator|nr:helix-turn-helix transcriptional regulator [Streptomycetaceae bacterium]